MPTWICDAPVVPAVVDGDAAAADVVVAAVAVDGDSDAAGFGVPFVAVEELAAELDECTAIFADVDVAAAAVAVDVVAAVDCSTAAGFAADARIDYPAVVAVAVSGRNERDTVAVADAVVAAVVAVADDECIDDGAETVAAVVDGMSASTAVSCRICRGVRRCYRHCLQQDDMGYRSLLLPCSFAGDSGCCCCRCCSSGEEVHYTVVGISRWTRALLAGSNHSFATWARLSYEIHCSRCSSWS